MNTENTENTEKEQKTQPSLTTSLKAANTKMKTPKYDFCAHF